MKLLGLLLFRVPSGPPPQTEKADKSRDDGQEGNNEEGHCRPKQDLDAPHVAYSPLEPWRAWILNLPKDRECMRAGSKMRISAD